MKLNDHYVLLAAGVVAPEKFGRNQIMVNYSYLTLGPNLMS